jgi:hypothetical protein
MITDLVGPWWWWQSGRALLADAERHDRLCQPGVARLPGLRRRGRQPARDREVPLLQPVSRPTDGPIQIKTVRCPSLPKHRFNNLSARPMGCGTGTAGSSHSGADGTPEAALERQRVSYLVCAGGAGWPRASGSRRGRALRPTSPRPTSSAQVLSLAAIDAQPLYAAPGHLVCIISDLLGSGEQMGPNRLTSVHAISD